MGIGRSCLIVIASLSACAPAPERSLTLEGFTMGTTYEVQIARAPHGVRSGALWADVDRIVQSVDAHMSTYDQRSELSRFNAMQTTEWFPVSQETASVVTLAQSTSRATSGAFDVTVGPLVELWGFGSRGPIDAPPSDQAITAVRRFVGYELLEVRDTPPALRKLDPRLTVDLSALAKGFAVDEVARHLDRLQIQDYLIELGGELRARGCRASGSPWRVSIEDPFVREPDAPRVIAAADFAIATSGSYLRVFEHADKEYSHILDPRTGRPVEHAIASVTVVAPSAAEADAYATALMVLDLAQGMELARRLELSVRWLGTSGGEVTEWSSPHFESEVIWMEGP